VRRQRFRVERGNAAYRPRDAVAAQVCVGFIPEADECQPTAGLRHDVDIEIPGGLAVGLQEEAAPYLVLVVTGPAKPQAAQNPPILEGAEAQCVLAEAEIQHVLGQRQVGEGGIAGLQGPHLDGAAAAAAQQRTIVHGLGHEIVPDERGSFTALYKIPVDPPQERVEGTEFITAMGEFAARRQQGGKGCIQPLHSAARPARRPLPRIWFQRRAGSPGLPRSMAGPRRRRLVDR